MTTTKNTAAQTLANLIAERDAVKAQRVAHLDAGRSGHADDMDARLAELRTAIRFWRIAAQG